MGGAEIVVDLYKGGSRSRRGLLECRVVLESLSGKGEGRGHRHRRFQSSHLGTKLSESSPAADDELVATPKAGIPPRLWRGRSEPDAGTGKQSTTVLWNTKTMKGKRLDWPADVSDWFLINSMLEAVHGRAFDRYPACSSSSAQCR
jgi:hypothetical protein